MEKTFEPDYSLDAGDVTLIVKAGAGFVHGDIGKYAEVVSRGDFFGREGYKVKPYEDYFVTAQMGNGKVGVDGVVGYESFGEIPLILLNTLQDIGKEVCSPRVKIRVNTNTHEYQGLYCGAGIEGCVLGVHGEAYFKYNGKDWMLDAGDFQVVDEMPQEGPFNSSLETRKNDKNQMELVDTGFPNALMVLGEVMTWAAKNKGYLPNDWKDIPNPQMSLLGAASRHRNKRLKGEEFDDESGLPHLAHEAFNVMAQLELLITGKL